MYFLSGLSADRPIPVFVQTRRRCREYKPAKDRIFCYEDIWLLLQGPGK